MTKPVDKSKRLRERIKLALPVRVHCRESADHDWVEMSRLVDVTPFGARFALTRPTERGRLLHLTLPMPRQLRCFDHIEDQYRVWALVCRVSALPEFAGGEGGGVRYEVWVAFTGKHPPASYVRDPCTLYEADSSSIGLWRSIRYGLGVLRTTLAFSLWRARLARPPFLDFSGGRLLAEDQLTDSERSTAAR